MSDAKVELGRYLFYDTRLSENGTQACATCHEQERAFTDGAAACRRLDRRGAPARQHEPGQHRLRRVADLGNPSLTRLEDQALVPMFGEHPVELGLTQPAPTLLARA